VDATGADVDGAGGAEDSLGATGDDSSPAGLRRTKTTTPTTAATPTRTAAAISTARFGNGALADVDLKSHAPLLAMLDARDDGAGARTNPLRRVGTTFSDAATDTVS